MGQVEGVEPVRRRLPGHRLAAEMVSIEIPAGLLVRESENDGVRAVGEAVRPGGRVVAGLRVGPEQQAPQLPAQPLKVDLLKLPVAQLHAQQSVGALVEQQLLRRVAEQGPTALVVDRHVVRVEEARVVDQAGAEAVDVDEPQKRLQTAAELRVAHDADGRAVSGRAPGNEQQARARPAQARDPRLMGARGGSSRSVHDGQSIPGVLDARTVRSASVRWGTAGSAVAVP